MLKREYEQVKSERKKLKDDIDKVRRDLISKSNALKGRTEEVSRLQGLLCRSEEDLKSSEKEKDILRKKLSHLKRAIRSPGASASSSFVETLMDESPMQSTPLRLNKPNSHEIDLDLTPDIIGPSPTTKIKRQCEENEIKYIKISSAANQNPAKKARKDNTENISNMTGMGQFNIFKKKQGIGDKYTTAIQKGYDGLGGHNTFTQPQGRPKLAVKKGVVRSRGLLKTNRTGSIPPLPSLNGFINID